jgi:programmed cell death protein 5
MDKFMKDNIKRQEQEYDTHAQINQQEKDRIEYESKKAAMIRQILTPEAKERLNTLKITKPELVASVEAQLISLGQSGRLKTKIDDKWLKTLLLQLQPKKREMQIKRM